MTVRGWREAAAGHIPALSGSNAASKRVSLLGERELAGRVPLHQPLDYHNRSSGAGDAGPGLFRLAGGTEQQDALRDAERCGLNFDAVGLGLDHVASVRRRAGPIGGVVTGVDGGAVTPAH
jgi:hypothetical protein